MLDETFFSVHAIFTFVKPVGYPVADDARDSGVRYPVPGVRIRRLPVVDVVVLHHNEAVAFRSPLSQKQVGMVLFFGHGSKWKIVPENHTTRNKLKYINTVTIP